MNEVNESLLIQWAKPTRLTRSLKIWVKVVTRESQVVASQNVGPATGLRPVSLTKLEKCSKVTVKSKSTPCTMMGSLYY